jgi:hypothetical protein
MVRLPVGEMYAPSVVTALILMPTQLIVPQTFTRGHTALCSMCKDGVFPGA